MNVFNLVRKALYSVPEIKWGVSDYENSFLVLKWGENQYQPSRKLLTSISKSLSTINKYPTLQSTLKVKIANYAQVDQSECLLSGADRAFRIISETFIEKDDEIIIFEPTFPIFEKCVLIMSGKVRKIPLDKSFKIPSVTKISRSITKRTKIICLCNPNNPTGNFIATTAQIENLLKLDLIIVVDEVYFEFSNQTCLRLLKKYSNLIIIRSFSKTFGLAGLRVGYILSSREIISYLSRVELSIAPFDIPTPSLAGAIAALDNIEITKQNIKQINRAKVNLTSKLKKMGLKVYTSATSFLLISTRSFGIKSKEFIQLMENSKIILKDVSIYSGLSEYESYMAIPNKNDIPRLVNAIKKIISTKTKPLH
ncbi:MAG: aminotransferase class I/II-fold pyridoxal phosphate-dependent enzyme [Patescibacteria group bacterium]|nr:aminotransferase class I/II-fold pyridoxal phosphate-dependent enzyme [Patescibacteria group bacterium]